MNKNNKNLNAMRILGVDAVNQANSGHPGIILGAAPIVYTLFTRVMNINPQNPQWFNRDRFVLSAGHGSGLLYSALHLAGYDLPIEEVKKFRQLNSLTPGHPEYGHTKGVDATTGPLGQGFAMGVGMALAESHLAAKYNQKGKELIDHYTYVLCGDGDLQEGVCQEAMSFAGRYQLNKLIVLHDSNDIQLDAPVAVAQAENMQEKFIAANWDVQIVYNGEDVDAIEKAIEKAKKSKKPSYIEVKTVIGIGATNEGTQKVHGAPLGNDIDTVKKYFNWSAAPFEISADIYEFYKKTVLIRGQEANEKWDKLFAEYQKNNAQQMAQLTAAINKDWNVNLDELLKLNTNAEQATRVSSGSVINYLNKTVSGFIGGSADLTESTKAKGADGNYDIENKTGRNIMYGVREFAMGSINNGIALHQGLLPFASGFFVFADYMKPAIRLSSIMGLQALYIFTHDSIAVGEDGPTHQPIEQLAMLRSMPNINVFRPCDMQETIASYWTALNDKNKPSVIVATRQNLKELTHQDLIDNAKKGGYLISKEVGANITLLAAGSEVAVALDVKEKLKAQGHKVNVVSMLNMNEFMKQDQSYIDTVVDKKTQRFSIELGSTFGWHRFLGDSGHAFGIDTYGYSAPFGDVIKHIKFTADEISNKIIKLLK
ncbi:transketolase [Spiroplasma clarkii]|uniref:Transketolase n=1 Tax=Spiroplasma clarkii TaxID=2139 RepID=A0A1Y0L1L1_9MOLU|nr:transketolase [Spiroplasma clarkii]ARU91589.1 transketolase [Spiroplasma clarkii]ATX70990.1 transketolase [Spiroplasma clarkii]